MTKIHPPMNALEEVPAPKGKPIEFVKYINQGKGSLEPAIPPSSFQDIRLVSRQSGEQYDIIAAWSEAIAQSPCVYLGHWNDGFVA